MLHSTTYRVAYLVLGSFVHLVCPYKPEEVQVPFFSNSQDYSDLDVSFWVILNKNLVHFVNPGHTVVQKEALYKVLRLFFITNHRDGHDKNINAEVL